MTQNKQKYIFAVIGDVHGRIELALSGLQKLERETGREINHVFFVGDLGLFLSEDDWKWLPGPSHHQHPEWTDRIQAAWREWPWPLSMIGGNHEPYTRLQDLDAIYFGLKLNYANYGELQHGIPDLRVYGVSVFSKRLHASHRKQVKQRFFAKAQKILPTNPTIGNPTLYLRTLIAHINIPHFSPTLRLRGR